MISKKVKNELLEYTLDYIIIDKYDTISIFKWVFTLIVTAFNFLTKN